MLFEAAFIDAITLTFDRWHAKWVQSGTREVAWQVYEHGAWAVYFARHSN